MVGDRRLLALLTLSPFLLLGGELLLLELPKLQPPDSDGFLLRDVCVELQLLHVFLSRFEKHLDLRLIILDDYLIHCRALDTTEILTGLPIHGRRCLLFDTCSLRAVDDLL